MLYISQGQHPCRVEFVAGIKPCAHRKAWELDMDSSMALASNLTKPRLPLYLAYRRRWNVETFFDILCKLKIDDRPKTITSHIVTTAANILLAAVGHIQIIEEELDHAANSVRPRVEPSIKRAMHAVATWTA